MTLGGHSRIQQPHPVQATVSSVLHSEDNFSASQPPKINLSLVEPRNSDPDAAPSGAEHEGATQASSNGALNGSHNGPSHGTNGAPNSQLSAAHLSSSIGAHPSPSLTPGFPPYGYFDAMSSLGLHAPSPMLMMPFTPTPGPANSPYMVPATPAPYYDHLLATPAAGATAAGTSGAHPESMSLHHAHAQYRHMFQHQAPGGPPPLDAFQLPPTALPSDYPSEVPRAALRNPHPGWRMSAASPALYPPHTPGLSPHPMSLMNPDPHLQQVHSSFARMSLSNYPSSPNMQPHNRRQPVNGTARPGSNGDPNASPRHHSQGGNGGGLGSPEQTQRSSPGVNGVAPGVGDSEWITGNRRDTGPYGRHQPPANDYLRMRSPAYMYQQPRGPHVPPMGRIPPSHGGGSHGGRPSMNGGGPHMNGMGPGGRRAHGGQGYSPQRGGPNMPPGADGYGPPSHLTGGHGPNGGPAGTAEYHIDDLSDIAPEQVAKYATTQYGSRALQDYVMQSDENFRMVFDAIFEPFSRLMVDLFGNYLCQKVLQKCNSAQLSNILKRLQKEIPAVSCDRQGTRVMQRIIQHAEEDAQIEMVIDSIRGQDQVRHLMLDSHGCYVINAMIEFMPIKKVVFIFDVAVEHCEFLASDQHGLCVLKKCLQRTASKQTPNKTNANARGNDFTAPVRRPRPSSDVDKQCMQEQYDRLASKVLRHALDFVDNQFGNYLVQCLLDLATEKVRDEMHGIFRGRYCEFSMKKFSSNVVERFLKSGSQPIREGIVDELIRSPNFATLLQDGFGNYVIQNSLVTAPPGQAKDLMDIIQPLLPTLRRNVRRKWERLIKSVRSRQEKKQRENVAAAARARAAASVLLPDPPTSVSADGPAHTPVSGDLAHVAEAPQQQAQVPPLAQLKSADVPQAAASAEEGTKAAAAILAQHLPNKLPAAAEAAEKTDEVPSVAQIPVE